MYIYILSSLFIFILYFYFFKSCYFRKLLIIIMIDIFDESIFKKFKKIKIKIRKLFNF